MSHNQKSPQSKPVSVVWLRRDLRLHDHAAIARAQQNPHPVQPVFIFDSDILARFANASDKRLTFIVETLFRLHGELQKHQSGIAVFHGRAELLVPRICNALSSPVLYAEEDYEPATRLRDRTVAQSLGLQTLFTQTKDHVLFSPTQVLKEDKTPFRVFTPYANAWRKKAESIAAFASEQKVSFTGFASYSDSLSQLQAQGLKVLEMKSAESLLAAIGYKHVSTGWDVSHTQPRLREFARTALPHYDTGRDFMAQNGTSRLSPYLRHGLISIRECYRIAREQEIQGSKGATIWINELIWRDFYAMILYHYPETQTQEFLPQYRGLHWSKNEQYFLQFTEGKTGYPIIDAAMRELLQTGYMHNRSRMIVASFMTKDLLLDWRWGEEHFAQYLMDYELASNVGGWQWAASVGTDAQPYFRIFNPVLQGKRFDPEGDYIRRFVPELAHLGRHDIHEPWKKARPAGYPPPIVDHAGARAAALQMYKSARQSS